MSKLGQIKGGTSLDRANLDGVNVGIALAAAIIVRTFDNPTIALEVLGAAGLDRRSEIVALGLDEYDAKPLLGILKK